MKNTRNVEHGTVTFLEKIEFLQKNLLAAHTVWVNNSEVKIKFRCHVDCFYIFSVDGVRMLICVLNILDNVDFQAPFTKHTLFPS